MEEKARYGLRRCVPDAAGPALLTVAGGRVEFGGSGNGYIPEGTGAILKGTLSRRSSFTKYVGASSTVQITLRDRADFRISRNMSIFSQYGSVALNVETQKKNGWSNVSVWSSCSVDSPSGITLSYHSGTDSWRFDGDKQKDLPNGTTVKVECSVRSGSMAGTATYEETKR
jgi:hypothetical protein